MRDGVVFRQHAQNPAVETEVVPDKQLKGSPKTWAAQSMDIPKDASGDYLQLAKNTERTECFP
jgi:hypothetical protein